MVMEYLTEKIRLIMISMCLNYDICDLLLGLKKNCFYDGRWEIWNKTLANAATLARGEVSSVGKNSSNGHQAVEIVARNYRILRESIWDGTVIVGR